MAKKRPTPNVEAGPGRWRRQTQKADGADESAARRFVDVKFVDRVLRALDSLEDFSHLAQNLSKIVLAVKDGDYSLRNFLVADAGYPPISKVDVKPVFKFNSTEAIAWFLVRDAHGLPSQRSQALHRPDVFRPTHFGSPGGQPPRLD
jgi:hypothetical protein